MTAFEFLNQNLKISHFCSEKEDNTLCFSGDLEKAINDFANYRISEIKKQILNEITDSIEYLHTNELDEFECITIENLEGILNNIK